MQKRYFRIDIVIILGATLGLLIWLLASTGNEHLPSTPGESNPSNSLTVSQDGSQTTTNVSGSDLQSASPPAASTTNTSLSPQQAVPYQAQ